MMNISRNREFPVRTKKTFTKVGSSLLVKLGLLGAYWLGLVSTAPAIANLAAQNDEFNPQGQVTADDVTSACGPLPVDAYVPHGSLRLKRLFCELLAFAPFSLSSIESFASEIVPESMSANDEPSPEDMTLPSFWWSRNSLPRQFGSYRLVDSWTAYEIRDSATRVIDVHINPQIWRILKYSERYGALNHLAEDARAYQYNLRLYSTSLQDPRLIGLYVCDFVSEETARLDSRDFDSVAGCVALIDAESIARLQISLEPPEEVAQSTQDSQPPENAEAEMNPSAENLATATEN